MAPKLLGPVRIPDASPGDGREFISDVNGTGLWRPRVYEQDAAPSSPKLGDLWVETDVNLSGSGIPLVTSLPGSPLDGQEVYYVADTGIIWHLRYNAGSLSTYKWEFLGGPPMVAEDAADTTFTGNGIWQRSPSTPKISLPRLGIYDYSFYAQLYVSGQTAGGAIYAGLGLGSSDPDPTEYTGGYTISGQIVGSTKTARMTLSSFSVIQMNYNCPAALGGTPHCRYRTMSLKPVQVI